MEEPRSEKPTHDTEEPIRAKDRTDIVDPTDAMLITDKENTEPTRLRAKQLKVLPRRVKPRSDSDEPRCKKSKTDSALPIREKLLSESDDPM